MTDELEFVNHWILIPIGEMLRLNVRAASRTPTLLRSLVRWWAGGGSSASPHTQLWGDHRLGRQGGIGEQQRVARLGEPDIRALNDTDDDGGDGRAEPPPGRIGRRLLGLLVTVGVAVKVREEFLTLITGAPLARGVVVLDAAVGPTT